jgi:hypothetical protein
MTRRTSRTAIASLLVGIVLAANAALVGADAPCILDNDGNCASVVPANANGADDVTPQSRTGGEVPWTLQEMLAALPRNQGGGVEVSVGRGPCLSPIRIRRAFLG